MIKDNTQILSRNLRFYYLAQILLGLRFMAPVWILFFTNYLNFGQVGLLEAVGLFIVVLLELPSGVLADLVGRKYTVSFGYLLVGVGFVIIGLGTNFNQFLLGYAINSIGGAFVSGADTALLFDTLKQNNQEHTYDRVAGKGTTLFRLSIIIAMITGQYLYQIFIGLPYVAIGITTLLAASFYFSMTEPKIDSKKFTFHNYLKQFRLGFVEISKNQQTKLLSVYFFLIAGVEITLLWFYYAAYLSWLGYTDNNIGWIYGVIALTRMLVSFYSYRIEKIFGERLILFGLPLVLALVLLLAGIRNIWLGSVLIFIHYSLFALRYTLLDKYINLGFESRYRASAISSLNIFISLFYAIVVISTSNIFSINNIGVVLSFFGMILLLIVVPLGYKLSKTYK